MGEVRARAKLTNAWDAGLARRGQLAPERVRTYEADALVDPWAIRCVLPPHVVERLGLDIIGQRFAEYADGRREAVDLTESFLVQVLDREEFENPMVLGDEVIVGLTALEKMDLLVDPINRRVIPTPRTRTNRSRR